MLFSEYDLNNFFDKDDYDIFSIGEVSLPTGEIVICDIINNLGIKDNMIRPFINKVDPGDYNIMISVGRDETCKDKYVAVKIEFNKVFPVKYEIAIKYGDVLKDLKPGQKYGFNVDSGLICVCDKQVENLYENQLNDWDERDKNKDILSDYFLFHLKENSKKNPKYSFDDYKWMMWKFPDTQFKIPVIASAFDKGFYSCYWGLDKNDDVCNLVIQFLSV